MNTQPLILDMGHIQRRIRAVQLDIARYGVTLRLADFATLLMLFGCFCPKARIGLFQNLAT